MGNKYFSGLNYTLGNEDTSVEIALINQLLPKNVFTICGSGGRSLPLLNKKCESITLADLSLEQLFLAELRYYSYKHLSYEDFCLFWGYYPFKPEDHHNKRRDLFRSFDISPKAYAFLSQVFHEINYESLLYLGKWERTFTFFAKINRIALGKDFDRILRFDSLDDQKYYYHHHFPMTKWKGILHVLGNKTMFNALLYKGDFIQKNSPLTHFQYYFNAFDRLFTTDLAQKSFFLHLCFYGKINSLAGVPIEAQKDAHQRIQESKGQVFYVQEDFVSHLAVGKKKYDFLSLSDVPSYFSGELERDFMQKIKPSLEVGAIVVTRYYLRKSECLLDGYLDITDKYKNFLELEKVQMYDIKIYQYQP
jgi:S-adenosylmethionine-diacylglycerol 3-amino-3-carboxypropyl transferase